jgi:hypothetical protein
MIFFDPLASRMSRLVFTYGKWLWSSDNSIIRQCFFFFFRQICLRVHHQFIVCFKMLCSSLQLLPMLKEIQMYSLQGKEQLASILNAPRSTVSRRTAGQLGQGGLTNKSKLDPTVIHGKAMSKSGSDATTKFQLLLFFNAARHETLISYFVYHLCAEP